MLSFFHQPAGKLTTFKHQMYLQFWKTLQRTYNDFLTPFKQRILQVQLKAGEIMKHPCCQLAALQMHCFNFTSGVAQVTQQQQAVQVTQTTETLTLTPQTLAASVYCSVSSEPLPHIFISVRLTAISRKVQKSKEVYNYTQVKTSNNNCLLLNGKGDKVSLSSTDQSILENKDNFTLFLYGKERRPDPSACTTSEKLEFHGSVTLSTLWLQQSLGCHIWKVFDVFIPLVCLGQHAKGKGQHQTHTP